MAYSAFQLLALVVLIMAIGMVETTPPGIAKNPSHATCKDKKYKQCYNLVHVCPKFCPDNCTVECASCKPICGGGSNPPPKDPPLPSPPPFETHPPPSPSPPTMPPPPLLVTPSPPITLSPPSPTSPPISPPPSPPHSPSTPPTKSTPSPPSPVIMPPPPLLVTPSPPITSSPPSPPLAPITPPWSSPHSPSIPPTKSTPSLPSPVIMSPPPLRVPPSPSTTSPPSPPTSSTPPPPIIPPQSPPHSPSTPSTPPITPPQSPPPTPLPSPPPSESHPSPSPITTPPPPITVTPIPPIASSPLSPPLPPRATPTPSPPISSSSARKRVRCRNADYPKCYNIIHTCPNGCPGGCKVDCVTCKPVCECDIPGAVCQDPRFIGGDGITFYFHGKKDRNFCLVSDPNLHINAHLIGKRNQNLKRDFTWVQSLGILFNDHRLFIGAKETALWDDSVDRLSLALNGERITISESEGSQWQSLNSKPIVSIIRLATTNNIMVEAEGLFRITVKVVPITEEDSKIHNYGITKEGSFAHLDLRFKFFSLSSKVSGVLGQTYSPEYRSRINVKAKMAVMGRDEEFETTSLFAADCAVERFRGGSGAIEAA